MVDHRWSTAQRSSTGHWPHIFRCSWSMLPQNTVFLCLDTNSFQVGRSLTCGQGSWQRCTLIIRSAIHFNKSARSNGTSEITFHPDFCCDMSACVSGDAARSVCDSSAVESAKPWCAGRRATVACRRRLRAAYILARFVPRGENA